ncbi:MAG: bacillolysin [Flavobacterium sp.]|jgi:bacillolysin
MKTKLLAQVVLSTTVCLFGLKANAQEAKEKVTDKRGRPSLIIFNETSSHKDTDSQKEFKEQLELKDNSSFVEFKSENDKLGFLHEKF